MDTRSLRSLVDSVFAAPPARGPEEVAVAGPSVEEAKESYAYWSRRARELPWYRRAERREAQVLAHRWHERLATARRERYGRGAVGSAVALVADGPMPRPPRPARRVRTLALAVGGTVVVGSTVAVVATAEAVAHVVGLLF